MYSPHSYCLYYTGRCRANPRQIYAGVVALASILSKEKEIQAKQVPGWSQYYLDYKFLKKIISSLAANRPASEAAALALGVRPSDILNAQKSSLNERDSEDIASILGDGLNQPPLQSTSGQDDDRGPDFQAIRLHSSLKLDLYNK